MVWTRQLGHEAIVTLAGKRVASRQGWLVHKTTSPRRYSDSFPHPASVLQEVQCRWIWWLCIRAHLYSAAAGDQVHEIGATHVVHGSATAKGRTDVGIPARLARLSYSELFRLLVVGPPACPLTMGSFCLPTAATTVLAERLVWGKAGSVQRQGTILLRW